MKYENRRSEKVSIVLMRCVLSTGKSFLNALHIKPSEIRLCLKGGQ